MCRSVCATQRVRESHTALLSKKRTLYAWYLSYRTRRREIRNTRLCARVRVRARMVAAARHATPCCVRPRYALSSAGPPAVQRDMARSTRAPATSPPPPIHDGSVPGERARGPSRCWCAQKAAHSSAAAPSCAAVASGLERTYRASCRRSRHRDNNAAPRSWGAVSAQHSALRSVRF